MKEMWTESGFTKRNRGRMGIMGSVAVWLGVAFAIVGIISEATITLLGLYPTSWYLLAIASFVFSLGCWLGWAVGIYLHTREPETEKEPEQEPESIE
jgi:hypothetical protein